MPSNRRRSRRVRFDGLPPVAVAWLKGEPPPDRALTLEESSVVLGLVHFDDVDMGGRIIPLREVLDRFPEFSRDNPHQRAWSDAVRTSRRGT